VQISNIYALRLLKFENKVGEIWRLIAKSNMFTSYWSNGGEVELITYLYYGYLEINNTKEKLKSITMLANLFILIWLSTQIQFQIGNNLLSKSKYFKYPI
jgi:hypothetical protein